MKSNWEEKIQRHLRTNCTINSDGGEEIFYEENNVIQQIKVLMNLVFEATKKECADNFYIVGGSYKEMKESILNMNKPNL